MAYRRKQGVAAADHRSSYPQDSASSHGYTSFKSIDEPKLGLWRTLATRAKGILDEDGLAHKFEDLRKERPRSDATASSKDQAPNSRWSFENHWKAGDAASRIRPEALSASVNQLSGKIKNALEEGLTIVDNKTSSIIEETKKIQIRRKPAGSSPHVPNSAVDKHTLSTPDLSLRQPESAAQETGLKASRDVANAMAAKAKLVLRELKSVKADLAFAKQRCAQLEEENRLLRETKQKGSKTEEDDDLIRVQLETLLSEKSRLAQENSTYARENRFLREIVDFHQFTTHDVVSLDDGDMEGTEPEEDDDNDNGLICAENVLPAVEENPVDEEHCPVPSKLESPVASLGEPSSSPRSSDCHSASKPDASASDVA
ncbi:uncharacterized protein LOC100275413 [Zea mays]|uniref:Uncharacterized protein n=1 Tax=Zea mays TaxID=4577 RepID=A0A1D6NQP0_MAIZE|nr:uncharacterized protein LOC100275413 [Zea mays]ONM42242.1 hypothetical protein ZEAMMB73_Zm00001d044674 [Zea mays]|eukprot:NP_001142962.2 uncharacterized protein LOC100275413 [Zea mays]